MTDAARPDERPAPCSACGRLAGHAPTFASLQRCLACGFISFDAAAVDVNELYDDAYFAGGEYADYRGQEPAIRRSMRRHLVQMSRYQRAGGALLEVGCAYGFFLDEARGQFESVAGVDVAEGAVSYAHELLAPGGHLFITTGDIDSFNARLRGAKWRQIHPPTHVNYFSKRTLALMLERLGFRVAGVETASYYHTLFDVCAILELRGGAMGKAAGVARRVAGPHLGNRLGVWVDLRDILFVAAARQ